MWAMPALFALVMAFPATREFFALYPPPLIVWLASFGIAALVWSFARLFLPPDGRWARERRRRPSDRSPFG